MTPGGLIMQAMFEGHAYTICFAHSSNLNSNELVEVLLSCLKLYDLLTVTTCIFIQITDSYHWHLHVSLKDTQITIDRNRHFNLLFLNHKTQIS